MKNSFYLFNETEEDLTVEIATLDKLFTYALEKENLTSAEFNVIFVDEAKIQEINREYRNIDQVTDVISFALEDYKEEGLPILMLGDIYICVARAHQQSEEYGHSFLRELCFLAVHGFFHLLGYDHQNEEEEKIMFAKQEELLTSFGIGRD